MGGCLSMCEVYGELKSWVRGVLS